LYVDAQNVELSPGEEYYSKALDKQVETLGDKNADLQVTRFGANTQPYYFFIDAGGNKLAEEGYGYDPGIEKFINLLEKVKEAYKFGTIKPGDSIVEATSGNTGISFSAIGKALGHNVKIIMPDWLSTERINIIKSLGAEVFLVSKEEGGFLASIERTEKIAAD